MKGIKAWMLVGLAACAVASEVRAQGDQATPDRMTREKYSLYLERFNAGDDRYAELYDPEVVFTHAPMFGVLRGRQAIIDFYAGMRSQIKETVTASAVVIDNQHGIMAAELSTELVAKRDGVKLPSAMLNKGEKVVTRGTVYYGLRKREGRVDPRRRHRQKPVRCYRCCKARNRQLNILANIRHESAIMRRLLLLPLLLSSTTAVAQPSSTILAYRHGMFSGSSMSLANRTIEMMFDTARVDAPKRAGRLAGVSQPLDFTYEFEGVRRRGEEMLERTATDGLLILKDGKVVHEAYLNRATPATHFISYSMAKTFNSVMLGFAIKEGQVKSVKDPVIHYLPDLRGTAYDGATLEDLLRMRSGTDWNDNFFVPGPAKDINERSFIRNEARYVSAASWPKRKHAPGASFNYNTVDAALIGRVVEVATGKPINQYMSERLWKPAGMQSYGFYVLDGPPGVGHAFTGGGVNAVMRDYGRIGQLMLEGGVANGRRLLDATWVSQSTADSDPATLARPGMGYGYFWWTLKGGAAYTALGGEGQFLFVDPATRTVIVKLSHANVGPGADKTMGETIAFLQAASAWTPAATR